MQLPSSDQRGATSDGAAACPDESNMLAFVEGRLSHGERSAIDVHLSTCTECRQLVSALAQGGLVLGDTRQSLTPAPAATAVLDGLPSGVGMPAGASRPSGNGSASAPPLAGATTSPLLRPGDRVADRYVVERAIGSGGMGVVAAAKHLGLGRVFAIKLLDPRYAGSKEATSRFLREARASAQLRGEHVVQVTDTGETLLPDGSMAPFLVMELLEGIDLSKTTALQKPLPTAEAVWLILQACEALAEAHQVGIIHRDIKPANLIVTRKVDGTPHLKVVDFGISKAHDIARSLGSLTSQNVVMGTPRYMAPEQMRSSKDVDGRADVWALGAVLYELLAGIPAFEAPSLTELITRVQLEEPTALTAAAPQVPTGLAAVVHRALRKNPAERIATVADLADLLGPFAPAASLHHIERAKRYYVGARPSLAPHPSTAPASAQTPAITRSDERRVSPFALVAFSGGALLLGVAFTAALLFWRQASETRNDSVQSAVPPTAAVTGMPSNVGPSASARAPSTAETPIAPLAMPSSPSNTLHAGATAVPPATRTLPPAATARANSSAAVTPTVAPAPVVPPQRPTAQAPEDPHSLRQRE